MIHTLTFVTTSMPRPYRKFLAQRRQGAKAKGFENHCGRSWASPFSETPVASRPAVLLDLLALGVEFRPNGYGYWVTLADFAPEPEVFNIGSI
jgi:hypothetical protein